ncbi:MAG: amino acid ABC transporter substrate-binding protein [Thermodesulfobacteriota bacterium]
MKGIKLCLLAGLIFTLGATGVWAKEAPLKIGGSLPLTGPFAETGQWVERGYRYWAEEANAKGGLLGRPVELIIYDDQSNTQQAITLAEKAITVDKVDLLCGGYPGTAARAVMPVAEKYKMVYVSMGGHLKSFEQGYTYSFGGPPLMGEWWYLGLTDWLAAIPEADRPKRAAVYTMNNPIGASVMEFLPTLKKAGLEVAIDEKYNLPLPDATPLIVKAKQMNCDILFSNGFFDDGVQTLRAAKALDYNPKIIVQAIGSVIPAWVKELGPDGDHVVSGTPIFNKLKFEGNDRLNRIVKEKFNLPGYPLYFGFGYQWMWTLAQGVQGAGGLDQTKIRDWLRRNEIKSLVGPMKFDDRGLPKPYNFLTQLIDGQVEIIWPKEQRTHEPVFPRPAWKK